MASQRLFGKSWNSSTSFTMKLYSSCTSSSLCNQYAFFSFHTSPPKRCRSLLLLLLLLLLLFFDPDSLCQTGTKKVELETSCDVEKTESEFQVVVWEAIAVATDILLVQETSSIPVGKEVEGIVDPASFTVVRFALSALPFNPFVLRAQDNVIVVPLLDGMSGAVVPARTWFGALMALLGVAMLESSGSPPCLNALLFFVFFFFFLN
ncbi:hypothetical protein L484_022932 [Morus notabilis]|uniref:Uncharacterized protein n=1 Tax=Morus notabilis TaxID=981085 RepID=W9RFP9_9ROSA|nr:hypothetical protein L484_022932 [Morus notabilis]